MSAISIGQHLTASYAGAAGSQHRFRLTVVWPVLGCLLMPKHLRCKEALPALRKLLSLGTQHQ
jgi:hypothetical protein